MATQQQINICLNCPYPTCKGHCKLIADSRTDGIRQRANEIKDKKQRYNFYLSHGICPQCKERKITPGFKTCPVCRKYSADWWRRRRMKDQEEKDYKQN